MPAHLPFTLTSLTLMESKAQQRLNAAQPNCAPHGSFPHWQTSPTRRCCHRHLTTTTRAAPDRNATQRPLCSFSLFFFSSFLNAEQTRGYQKHKDERDTKRRAQSPPAARKQHSAPPSAAPPLACLITSSEADPPSLAGAASGTRTPF